MEAAAIHAFEQDEMPAGIHDRARARDPGAIRRIDGRSHHLLCALMREALALGDIHTAEPGLRRIDFPHISVTPPAGNFGGAV
jgi:hypothetical protein